MRIPPPLGAARLPVTWHVVAVHLLERGAVRARREENGVVAILRRLDIVLLGATAAIACFGVVMVYSATRTYYPLEPTYFVKRQVIYLALGVVFLVLCAAIDYRRLEHLAYPIYGATVASLLAVKVIGKSNAVGYGTGATSSGQTQRWLPLGPVHFQPSEFGVLAVVAALGCFVQHHEHELTFKRLVQMLVMAGVPMLLIFKQPDVGTTFVLAVTLIGSLVFAGVRMRLLALMMLGVVGAVIAGLVLHVLGGSQISRLTCFLHQTQQSASGCNYQLFLSREAIGAGGLKGVGLFHGTVTNLQYIPEQYADFIFSAIGEQTGFVGSAVLLGLYAVISLRMVRAMQTARDALGRILCGGALIFLVVSVFQNVGMNIGLMPITGIPLPFVSYGGSAMLAFFAAVGLVINVELRRVRLGR